MFTVNVLPISEYNVVFVGDTDTVGVGEDEDVSSLLFSWVRQAALIVGMERMRTSIASSGRFVFIVFTVFFMASRL
jgi:hypothetical protein